MSDEKHDPWALLREARNWVGGWSSILPMAGKDIDALRTRIDAALAEHDAVPPSEEKVEWREHVGRSHETVISNARLNDSQMVVFSPKDERWYWEVTRFGDGNTEDEAKSAAIAAARGMR